MKFSFTLTCLGCNKPVLQMPSLDTTWDQILTLSLTLEEEKHREQCSDKEAKTGDYRLARGVLPRKAGDPSPEEMIRRGRDD